DDRSARVLDAPQGGRPRRREEAMILFVGERRSPTAIRMGWTWASGRLAARTLYDALENACIKIGACDFINLFEVQRAYGWPRVLEAVECDIPIVGMGRRV